MAFYIRCFDLENTTIDEKDFNKLTTSICNNAPDALPMIPGTNLSLVGTFDALNDLASRTVTITLKAKMHIELFTLKMLYALYYKTTGKTAGSSNRYLVHWAQAGTAAAQQMDQWSEQWFGVNIVGTRPNIDLGNQFSYQTGYHTRHGVCGIKIAFGGAFVMFGVIGPALDMKRGKLELPLCPSIGHLGSKLNTRKI